MNAVEYFAELLTPDALRRLAALRVIRFDASDVVAQRGLDIASAHERVLARWDGDLCGFLNVLTRSELTAIAVRLGVATDDPPEDDRPEAGSRLGTGLNPAASGRHNEDPWKQVDSRPGTRLEQAGWGRAPVLRERLWQHGAALESGGVALPATLQPRPVVLGGHLVVQAPPRGLYAASDVWPRALPGPRLALPPSEEPETLDDLLAAADRVIGVRLGRRGLDKGAWGLRAARLLGVIERGVQEPDWRGDVEIKTVPVACERTGRWRIVEDPAIAMLGEAGALAKLQRTLWLARADVEQHDATIVSWYLLEWDAAIAGLARRYLHVRPKGPAGTDQRGLYLQKKFFADAGLLATLNGQP